MFGSGENHIKSLNHKQWHLEKSFILNVAAVVFVICYNLCMASSLQADTHHHHRYKKLHQNPYASSAAPAQSRQLRQLLQSTQQEKGYCAPYTGKICKDYVQYANIWYSMEDPSGGWKHEQITTALWDELVSDLNGLCRMAAEVGFQQLFK